MHRFFVTPDSINSGIITITGDDVAHLSKVLRIREGETIIICDGMGTDYICRLITISKTEAVTEIIDSQKNTGEAPINITLYQGLPKSDKMDYIVQKCVELGAVRIVPVITKRAVAIPHDSEKKIARWQKIANEAAKQCGRGILPKIDNITTFEQAINQASEINGINIIPYENEKCSKLKDALIKKNNINVFIGPEGGFDESEIDKALSEGIIPVSLGPRILRTETAPIAAIAAIMYELGDW